MKEYPGIANPKGYPCWRQTELIPRCQRENSNEYPSWRQKESIPRQKRKQRGITESKSPGIFIPKGDLSCRQEEVNYEVPAGKFLRSLQFLTRSELAPKGINSKVPSEEFRANGV